MKTQSLSSHVSSIRSSVWFQSGRGPKMTSSSTPCRSTTCTASLTSFCAHCGWAPPASCCPNSCLRRSRLPSYFFLSFFFFWYNIPFINKVVQLYGSGSDCKTQAIIDNEEYGHSAAGWKKTFSSFHIIPSFSFPFHFHFSPPSLLLASSPLPPLPSISLSSSPLSDCQTKCLGLSDELPCVALYLTNADSRQGLKQRINR